MSETTTLRLHDRRKFRREIKELEVEHDDILNADTVDVHTAIVQLAIDNPDLLRLKLKEVQNE